jgi:hypothetical protein
MGMLGEAGLDPATKALAAQTLFLLGDTNAENRAAIDAAGFNAAVLRAFMGGRSWGGTGIREVGDLGTSSAL